MLVAKQNWENLAVHYSDSRIQTHIKALHIYMAT